MFIFMLSLMPSLLLILLLLAVTVAGDDDDSESTKGNQTTTELTELTADRRSAPGAGTPRSIFGELDLNRPAGPRTEGLPKRQRLTAVVWGVWGVYALSSCCSTLNTHLVIRRTKMTVPTINAELFWKCQNQLGEGTSAVSLDRVGEELGLSAPLLGLAVDPSFV